MIRPHHEVSQRLARRAADAGFLAHRWAPYIADILALHVGLPEYIRDLTTRRCCFCPQAHNRPSLRLAPDT